MSSITLVAILVMAVLAVLAAIKKKQRDAKSVGFPYKPAKTLFSPAERSFLGVLDRAVGLSIACLERSASRTWQ